MAMNEAAKRRVRAGRLLQQGKGPAEVARLVGAPRQTVYRWREVLHAKGIDGLREMSKGGRPAQLNAEQYQELREALLKGAQSSGFGTDLWTLKRVRQVIEKRFGVRFSEVHVWRLLGRLGFSSQKPEKRAAERDEAAIAHWRRRTWPALKKRPARRTIDCLRRRIRTLGAAHSGAYLGAERPNARNSIPFQLEAAVDDRRLERAPMPVPSP